jgi:hypothetical protein
LCIININLSSCCSIDLEARNWVDEDENGVRFLIPEQEHFVKYEVYPIPRDEGIFGICKMNQDDSGSSTDYVTTSDDDGEGMQLEPFDDEPSEGSEADDENDSDNQ